MLAYLTDHQVKINDHAPSQDAPVSLHDGAGIAAPGLQAAPVAVADPHDGDGCEIYTSSC